MTSSPQDRLKGLDALRGLAALAVVLFHYTVGYEVKIEPWPSAPLFRLPDGHFGVELFFCISGFVILGTLERATNLKTFAIARFARLYPAYLTCAAITLGVIVCADLNIEHLDARAIAVNMTMLTTLANMPFIDPSYWTLTYEVLFYAVVAIIWFSFLNNTRKGRLEIPCLAWLVLSLLGHFLNTNHHRLAVLLNSEYAYLFVIGMMLYYVYKRNATRLTFVTLAAALLMALLPADFTGGAVPQFAFAFMIWGFSLAIWLVTRVSTSLFAVAPIVFLGEISYSLYLVHQIAGYALIRTLLRYGITPNAAIVITIAAAVIVAASLRHICEKPAEKWIKKVLNASHRHAHNVIHLN